MFSTSNFNSSLLTSVISFMNENNVERFDLEFLALGNHGFPETSAIAKRFIEVGHWEYFFVKDNNLFVHFNYNGKYGLGEYNKRVVGMPLSISEDPNNETTSFATLDMVNLVRVAYDTIGNINFKRAA